MKKCKNVLLVLGLCLMAGLGLGGTRAAAKTVNEILPGKTVRIDIDQDGKKESIRFTSKQKVYSDGSTGDTTTKVYIDGKKVLTRADYGYAQIFTVRCGKRNLLNVNSIGANDYIESCNLYYIGKNHKPKKIIDFAKSEKTGATIRSATANGLIVSSGINSGTLSTFSWRSSYKLKGNKVTRKAYCYKIEYTQVKNATYTTAKRIRLTNKVGSKAGFYVEKNKKVKLVKVTVTKGKWYGKFKYGKKYGYARVDDYKDPKWFKGLVFAG